MTSSVKPNIPLLSAVHAELVAATDGKKTVAFSVLGKTMVITLAEDLTFQRALPAGIAAAPGSTGTAVIDDNGFILDINIVEPPIKNCKTEAAKPAQECSKRIIWEF